MASTRSKAAKFASATETTWPCGEAARDELRALTEGRAVTCNKKDTDRYQRAVSVCSNGTVDLAAELTRAGLALAYREYSDDYIDEEDEARIARRGAWAGEFTAPWDERRGRDSTTKPQPDEDNSAASSCRGTGIKGNISVRTGERIYHVPGSSSYEETNIDESKGERWFCTEDEAEPGGMAPAARLIFFKHPERVNTGRTQDGITGPRVHAPPAGGARQHHG